MARLTWAARLHRPPEFKAAMEQGRRIGGALLSARALVNGLPHARLGLALAKKQVARASDRNRIKRHARESFRAHLEQLPPADIVIMARGAAASASAAQLRESLSDIWKRVQQQCATSPSS